MKTRLLTVAILLAALTFTSSSFAQSHFAQTHPRRAEVNRRLANQNARVRDKTADGKMSKAEAGKIHHEDHQVRKEERMMASQDHGHITKADKRALNQQENKISKQIKNH
jgi:hypothetical protein